MKNTFIFDLDGTLLNTINDLADSTNFALEKNGYKKRTVEEVRSFVGEGVRKLMVRALPNDVDDSVIDQCIKDFKEHYSKNMRNKTAPYEGIMELLKTLKDNNMKVGVVSNKFDRAVKELCKDYFGDLVDIAVGEREGIAKKPAPDSVFEALRILDAKKEYVLYIGDSDTDMETAKNAGVDSVGVTWGFRDKELLIETGAKYIAEKPLDILEISKI